MLFNVAGKCRTHGCRVTAGQDRIVRVKAPVAGHLHQERVRAFEPVDCARLSVHAFKLDVARRFPLGRLEQIL